MLISDAIKYYLILQILTSDMACHPFNSFIVAVFLYERHVWQFGKMLHRIWIQLAPCCTFNHYVAFKRAKTDSSCYTDREKLISLKGLTNFCL